MRTLFRWVEEEYPGARWLSLFRRAWPAYERWFLSEGEDARPDLETSRRCLRAHMPELIPLWERLITLSGGDETVARMLGLYRPARYLTGCSQAVWTRTAPLLVRNYDYHPAACEGIFLRSRWHDTTVIAASDCLWGAVDGMNEEGLAVALSFGGSRSVGDGFGIPLIVRYLLEFCASVQDAVEALTGLPSHMTYNLSILDRSGASAVVYVGPDRDATVVTELVSTNHQERVVWEEYARATNSLLRKRFLGRQLHRSELSSEDLLELFLNPPIYVTDYARGHGTLYTVAYAPDEGSAEFLWPEYRVSQSFDQFTEAEVVVPFPAEETSGRVALPLGDDTNPTPSTQPDS